MINHILLPGVNKMENIETVLAVSELRSENVIQACNGVCSQLNHLDKCKLVILSRLASFKRLVGGREIVVR
jgi:hypothetical protein